MRDISSVDCLVREKLCQLAPAKKIPMSKKIIVKSRYLVCNRLRIYLMPAMSHAKVTPSRTA